MELNLKPCPFCGGEAELNSTQAIASVRCKFCGACTKLFIRYPIDEADHVQAAMNKWNHRWEEKK